MGDIHVVIDKKGNIKQVIVEEDVGSVTVTATPGKSESKVCASPKSIGTRSSIIGGSTIKRKA